MIKAKRILSMLLVMLMLVGANIPAFAATKPTATYLTRESTHVVKRGKTAKLVYNLKCGSYSKKNNVWRSKLFIKIYKDSKYTRYFKDISFTGKQHKYTFSWKIPVSMATGRYQIVYYTAYRANKAAPWRQTGSKTHYLSVTG